MFGFMLPKGAGKVKLSKMNMGGMGTAMMQYLMKKKKVASLPEMINLAVEMGVKIYICDMSMDLMGFKQEEMIDYPGREFVGVAKFLEEAGDSKISCSYNGLNGITCREDDAVHYSEKLLKLLEYIIYY